MVSINPRGSGLYGRIGHSPSGPRQPRRAPFCRIDPSPMAGNRSPSSHWQRVLRVFRPSHRHTAFTATLLLMLSAFLSRIIGLVRVKYIAYLFGAGPQTDAFNSAFQLPDMIAYFLVGGVASVTLVTMLSRYRESGREEEGTRAMSVILTSMLLVLGARSCSPRSSHPSMSVGGSKAFLRNRPRSALRWLTKFCRLVKLIFFFAGGVFELRSCSLANSLPCGRSLR